MRLMPCHAWLLWLAELLRVLCGQQQLRVPYAQAHSGSCSGVRVLEASSKISSKVSSNLSCRTDETRQQHVSACYKLHLHAAAETVAGATVTSTLAGQSSKGMLPLSAV